MDIRPSADLRNKYAEISALCKQTHEPVYITVNGRGDTVIMDIAQYSALIRELELVSALARSEDDIRAGRVAPAKRMFDSARQAIKDANTDV